MSTTDTSTRVVTATDGTRGSRAAVVYAAQEAGTRGLPLEVVTVMPAFIPAGPFPVAPDAAMHRAAHQVLDDGLDAARQAVPGLDVSTTLLLGSRVDALAHHTCEAALLTVGAPPHGLAERLWTGSTVTGTAARVRCPLIIVPPEQGSRPRQHRILVGLKSSKHAEHLLGAAFAVAQQTQSDLLVLHTWHLLAEYDDVIAARTTPPERVTEMVRSIEDSMIDLRMAYPDVQVEVEVVHGQAAFGLVDASVDADLLLMSRPAHGGFVHHLGATARAVIRGASCPIEVVPPIDESLHVESVDAATVLVP